MLIIPEEEMWKPHRSFKDFKLTYKDLKIKKKEKKNETRKIY